MKVDDSIYKWLSPLIVNKKNVIVIIVLSIVVALGMYMSYGQYVSIDEIMLRLLYGHGVGEFCLSEMLQVLIYNMILIYLICEFYQKSKTDSNLFVLIRMDSIKAWRKKILFIAEAFCAIYVILTVSTYSIVLLFCNYFKMGNFVVLFMESDTMLVVFYFMINKLLELSFIAMLIFAMDIFMNSLTNIFIITMLLHFVIIIPISLNKYWPFGLGFVGRRSTWDVVYGTSELVGFLALFVCNILVAILLKLCIKRKNIN